MIDWLKKRLSPVKRDTSRWKELAEAIQAFWAQYFDPEYDVLAGLRSIYTADVANQRRIVAERGHYYEEGILDENLPISMSTRRMELHKKETDMILKRTIARVGLAAEWMPLYAPIDEPYGGGGYFLGDDLDPDREYFLTSRGRLEVDMSDTQGFAKVDLLRRRVRNVKPLHIVFGGFVYVLRRPIYAGLAMVSARTTTIASMDE